uniref:non-specific serine/threonine protein kinase n=1 Tax=Saccoglossus kowalevskii TaxID=10224 RepID=A0ABM0LUB2_SACKO|nr:PREDICTED: serine/threonine-protein kinase Nek4-like [Saccoglossus kowalevskii]
MSLPDYDKIRVVGKGSYGEVWLVKHKKDRKQYVLKKMDLQNASKRERKAAELEAKLLSKLRHPNIVSYKDSFETEQGFLFIAMGFCDGGDLYTRLKEQKGKALDEKQIVEWFVQIAMALQYMHERNILHRDLKTQNIFLTKSKIIKVGDLGIARVLDGHNDMATTLIGTPYYMSPELFSNKPYNHKSDVWALGCCVYEMSTLKHAFNARDMNSLVYKILRGKMPLMPRMYSLDLTDLIKAMLNQSPEKRPSVSRILRNPFIKKHIALFLEGTRQRRPSSSSSEKRPYSGSGDRQRPSSARSDVYELPVEQKIEVTKPSEPGDEKLDLSPDLEAIPEVSNTKEREACKTDSPKNTSKEQQVKVEQPSKVSKEPSKEVRSKSSQPRISQPRAKTDQPSRPAVEAKKGSKEVARRKIKSAREGSGSSGSSGSAIPIERPRANKARPLPPPPSESKGQGPTQSSSSSAAKTRPTSASNKNRGTSSNSSSVSSSKDNSHTSAQQLRKSCNSSARERRRLRESQERGGTPRGLPAVVERRRASETCSSTDTIDGVTPKSTKEPLSRAKSNPEPSSTKKKVNIVESKPEKEDSQEGSVTNGDKDSDDSSSNQSRKQSETSQQGESSSSTEELEEESTTGNKKEEKEMKRFSKMLETTLKMEDMQTLEDLSDKDSPDGTLITPIDVAPTPEVAVTPPEYMPPPAPVAKVNNLKNGEDYLEIEAAAPRAPKGVGNLTLTTCGRLMDRIGLLRKDILKGIGVEMLQRAYEILEDVDGEEVEPRLVDLMGKEKFDVYAGKIWQLKFCEETVFG